MQQMSPMLQAYIEQKQEINNSNQNNNAQYVDLSTKPDTFESSVKKEDENNKGKAAKILAIGAIIAAGVAGLIHVFKKGKSINLDSMTPEKFKQLQADKYTGKIKGKLKNGDNIVMEYVDGILKKSTRSGNVNFEKVYETINNEKIVKKTVDGVTSEFNITKTQQEVKATQEKIKSLLKDDKLSSDELKKQADTVKFKSNNQKKEIENTINSKKKAEAEAKTKLEAEQKAKTEVEAKERFEKREKEIKERARKQLEAEEAQKAEKKAAKELAYRKQVDKVEKEILDSISDEKFADITKEYSEFLDTQKVEYSHEIIRHATSAENAENIIQNGYDIYHATSNHGTSTFGGMDVEAKSLGNFGKRYGDTKLEYEFSGKALRLTDQVNTELAKMRFSLLNNSGKFNGTYEYKGVSMADMDNSLTRKILKKLGYDAVIFEQNGQDKFLTILDPNNTKGLKYIRTFSI